GIDRLLPTGLSEATPYPGRPSPITAANLALIGLALLLLRRSRRRLHQGSQFLSALVIASSSLAIIGYLYDLPGLYTVSGYSSISVHTAIAIGALGAASLMANPDRGLVGILANAHAGGYMARRLLPFAIVVPVLVGWLR